MKSRDAEAFDDAGVGAAQVVDAEAVFLRVDDVGEAGDEPFFLGVVDGAFEDGVLDALSPAFAGFGDFAEAAAAFFGEGVDVVGDEEVHGAAPGYAAKGG